MQMGPQIQKSAFVKPMSLAVPDAKKTLAASQQSTKPDVKKKGFELPLNNLLAGLPKIKQQLMEFRSNRDSE